MKKKPVIKLPVHSYAILPDGTALPIPGCKGYTRTEKNITVYTTHPDNSDALTLAILPAGSTLVTNWNHPDHA